MATKKSLFNKPKWAAKAASPSEDDRPIFQQNIYEDILQANRRKEQEKLERKKQKVEQQKRRSASRDTKVDENEQPVKKQRISGDAINLDNDHDVQDGSMLDSDSGLESNGVVRNKKRASRKVTPSTEQSPVPQSPAKKNLEHNMKAFEQNKEVVNHASITVGDSDDDDVIVFDAKPASPMKSIKSTLKKPPPLPPESDSDPDADDFVKELKRKARAEAQAKRTQATQRQDTPLNDGLSPSAVPPGSTHSIDGIVNRDTPTPAAADPSDPEVSIMIKTIIPSCEVMFVKRLASQPLGVVRDYFIKQHNLTPQIAQKIFFTWNGTKLYKSTTMRSILAQIKNKHGTKRDGSDLAEGKIEIEAVTEEIYQHRLAQKEREKQRQENGDTYSTTEEERAALEAALNGQPQPNAEQQPGRGAGTVIVLKSNDEETLPTLNLRVHPHTTIGKIVRGYKKKMSVDMGQQIYLVFEGEKLEEEQTVEDVGFEDMDSVDVRSK